MTQGEALTILKSGANVFLTGEPGSGKTHTINQYVTHLRSCGIEPSITASTGIAATHIGGMTVHSWSGIGIKKFLTNYDLDKLEQNERLVSRLNKSRVLIIDEISMLDAALFTSIEKICRTLRSRPEPFGGLQVIVVGDFFQLPPISRSGEPPAHFAFESPAWESTGFVTCYLSEQHRQGDPDLQILLSRIRQGNADQSVEALLHKARIDSLEESDQETKLFPHNVDVDHINNQKLGELLTTRKTFEMESRGNENIVAALRKSCLSPESLVLKEGAIVMCTKNNPEMGYVNGTLGIVENFSKETGEPIVKTYSGRKIVIGRAEWSVEDNGKILGTISQVPLRLAWAITIHKSQGMTLDGAVMDLSKTFEYGQGYVALSRVRSLSGLRLLGWNRRALEVHPKILQSDVFFKDSSKKAREEFGSISKKEIESLHRNFSLATGGVWPPKKSLLKKMEEIAPKVHTIDQTIQIFKDQKNATIASIAKARGLTEGTIVDHFEKSLKAGKIEKKEVARLFKNDTKIKTVAKATREAFKKLGYEKLSPVFSAFAGKYSFEDLRMARLLNSVE